MNRSVNSRGTVRPARASGPINGPSRGEAVFRKDRDRPIFGGLGREVLQINGRTLHGAAEDSRGGDSDRLLMAINELTEERRLEEILRRRTEKLEQSNKDLRQFAYAASHDLQELLRMVASDLQLPERRYRDDLAETAREWGSPSGRRS